MIRGSTPLEIRCLTRARSLPAQSTGGLAFFRHFVRGRGEARRRCSHEPWLQEEKAWDGDEKTAEVRWRTVDGGRIYQLNQHTSHTRPMRHMRADSCPWRGALPIPLPWDATESACTDANIPSPSSLISYRPSLHSLVVRYQIPTTHLSFHTPISSHHLFIYGSSDGRK